MFMLLVALVSLQGTPAQEVPPLHNFLKVTPEFCTGGQPRPEHLEKLRGEGIRSVLNLREPSEHRAAEEKKAVEAAGMKYFNIPVSYKEPTEEQVAQFLEITDDRSNRPMFIHCTAAVRVGAFWMIRRVLRDGMKEEAALAEARKVGLREDARHLEEFARDYIAKHKRK